jgi:hypothetical protein
MTSPARRISPAQKIMLRARFDEAVWGDAARVTMKGAFAQERAES